MARKSSRPSLRAVGVKRVGSGAAVRYQDRDTGRFLKSSTVKSRLTRAEREPAARPERAPARVPRLAPVPPPPLPAAPVQRLTPEQRRAALRAPVEIRDTFARFRDGSGRFVSRARVERLTADQRKARGIHREMFSRTKAGALGKRAKPLLDALRDFEAEGMDWREVPDHYRSRAVALSII